MCRRRPSCPWKRARGSARRAATGTSVTRGSSSGASIVTRTPRRRTDDSEPLPHRAGVNAKSETNNFGRGGTPAPRLRDGHARSASARRTGKRASTRIAVEENGRGTAGATVRSSCNAVAHQSRVATAKGKDRVWLQRGREHRRVDERPAGADRCRGRPGGRRQDRTANHTVRRGTRATS